MAATKTESSALPCPALQSTTALYSYAMTIASQGKSWSEEEGVRRKNDYAAVG